ncbi:TetR/AcrR family transcriptional regulator [Shimazuella alba]|jgi:AcrR family transcriptional regulator|uniref:TetR family transcriptional regulator n=1 Tax=Shimazuella alba TaxID=2690964 RepID=A0A6I4VZ14_9BACL|nr:TetR/AcrR family transcriptional regulator [Shimazuella alba]MXQ55190.1 TetR family transcriptional regulator [Shimazuella alba]
MPKMVNHEQRKKEIGQATWEIIQTRGIEEVSVRKIADQMNISSGSIRHYFPTQNELLRYCIRSAGENVHHHILSHIDLSLTRNEVIKQMVSEILPMEGSGQRDMDVWYSIITFAKKNPNLQDLSLRIFQYMRYMQKTYIDLLSQGGFLDETLDREVEVERLHALVDGLSLHWNANQGTLTKDIIRKALEVHLQSICK